MALNTFPVALTLAGRAVGIAGGGELALRKARLLAKTSARLAVFDPAPDPDFAALGADLHRRHLVAADLAGLALLFAATGDDARDHAVAALARDAGVPVNVPDRPDLSTFIMPAIIDRAPITVAISSGGASPVLVRRLRERLEAALDPGLGRFAGFLDQFRPAVKATRHGDTERRRFWEAVVDGPIGRAFLAGQERTARDRMLHAVNDPRPGRERGGSVALVGAGPGDPDLLTLRALRVLQDADVVVYDRLVDERILDYVRRDARRVFVGKAPGRHARTQTEIEHLLVAEAEAGHRVVRLKGGDPFVFGRGGEEVAAVRAAGLPLEIVPGITAALGCGAATTIPVTHRGMAAGVTILTGQSRDGGAEPDWAALARLGHTLVVYMGLATAGPVADRLMAAGMAGATPAALIENGTRINQRVAIGTLATLAALAVDHGLDGPTLIIIGEVVRLADPARIAALATEPHALAAVG